MPAPMCRHESEKKSPLIAATRPDGAPHPAQLEIRPSRTERSSAL